MDHDVGPVLDRPAQIRSGEGVVDDQWYAVFVSDIGDGADVEDVAAGLPIVSP